MTARKRATPAKAGSKSAKSAVAKAAKPAAKKVAKTKKAASAARPPAATKPKAGTKAAAKAKTAAKPVEPPKPVVEKTPPRGQLVPKLNKALKAHYKPFATDTSRSLLHQVMFSCCLENAPADAAERAFSRLLDTYFDLNEVRVTTVAELAETLHDLPDPARAALSLRRALQGVFESTYSFSLEHARKHSLAHGLKVLQGLHGVPPFVIGHVASTALGGHLIPLDKGALAGLWLCGIITQQEYDSGKVPGLERAIGKKAGVEFSSLLHQFGLDVLGNLHGQTVKKIVQAVNPAVGKERMPKPITDKAEQKAADAAQAAADELRPAGPQAAARPAGKTPVPPPGSGPKKGDGKGKSGPKPFVVKPLSIKPQQAPPEPPPAAKPAPASKSKAKGGDSKQASQLSKRKPR
jgi:hypothetical protein